MKWKSIFFAAILAFSAGSAYGQLLNGDFSNQGDFWDLFRADTRSGICADNLSLDTWSSSDLLWRGGSNDWAAHVHGGWTGIRGDFRTTCGSIRQNLVIPVGTRLAYSLRLGTVNNLGPAPSDIPIHQQVIFTASIETPLGRESIDSASGRSVNSPCFFGCPDWRTREADVSDFWGQSVDLEFFAQSSYFVPPGLSTGSRRASPAYIDNIRFEEIPANSAASPIAGLWFSPAVDGSGINISRSSTGQLQLLWYTYLPSGTPIWFISSLDSMSQGQWNATLDKAVLDPVSGTVQRQPVGTAEIRMLSNNELIFEWNLTAASGSPSQGGQKMQHLLGGDSFTGLWFEPGFDGMGFTLDVEGSGPSTVSAATIFFYSSAGQPIWGQGGATGDLTGAVNFDVNTFTGTGLCPGCAGQSQSLQTFPAGTFGLQTMNTQPAGFSAIQTAGGISLIRGSSSTPVTLGRLTLP